ncbi:hypothetical protein, partial [Methylobacterium sp. WL6]|uniref:hypothetical protein n=1 Tax=Methylobacterium sp. WL6 TaxID=2603901 RepID=UPI0011C8DCA5
MKPRPDVRKTGRLPPRHSLAARSGARRLGPCLRVAILGTAALAGALVGALRKAPMSFTEFDVGLAASSY